MPKRAGLYKRYSDDGQKETSLDDQERVIRAKALALGYEVSEEHVYSDSAITGQAKGLVKRTGYAKAVQAWEDRQFDVIIVDQICRMARDNVELAQIQARVERTGVRLVTADGLIDSNVPGWQLLFGLSSLIASNAIRETRHRVLRGMIGQLERGFMIAAPPFGYKMVRDEADKGTRWVFDEEKQPWVRKIFQLRVEGTPLGGIAKVMNEAGIESPRPSKKGGVRYWRPATVRQMLQNPIYKGIFIWNGSPCSKSKAKKAKKTLTPQVFLRPELQIVDEEIWNLCNAPSSGRLFRGGVRHLMAGLCRCNACNARLTVCTGGTTPTLYCAQCAQANRAGIESRKAIYVSARALQEVMLQALRDIFSEENVQEFRQELRNRLTGGERQRIEELKQKIERLKSSTTSLVQLFSQVVSGKDIIQQQILKGDIEQQQLAAELKTLQAGQARLDKATIEKQLGINPLDLLPGLFKEGLSVDKVRAALLRIFPRVVLLGRTRKYSADFLLEIDRGAGYAETSGTKSLDDRIITFRYRVDSGAKRPTEWVVNPIQDEK